MGLSSKWALICGGSRLDVFLPSPGIANQRQSASHYIWISGRASLRVEKTRAQGDPDHVVSDRHLWPELPYLHLNHGRERLPLRCTRFRPALLHHGRGNPLRGLGCCQPEETKLGVSLMAGAGVFGLGCTLAAMAPGYWWFGAALAVSGAAGLTFINGTNSIMQLSTEPAMRGRVMALRVGIALGGAPIGAPIVGWVANHFGPRWALGVGAGAGLTAALVAAYVLARRKEPLLAR